MGLSLMEQKAQEWEVTGRYPIDARSVNPYNSSFETLVKDLKRWKREKYGIILMCASGTRAKRLAADLQEEELNSFYSEDPERVVKPTEIMVVHGSLHRGYEYPMIRFAVLSETRYLRTGKEKAQEAENSTRARRSRVFRILKPWEIMWSMRITAWASTGVLRR